MDNEIKSNGLGGESLLKVENAFDLLRIFQIINHLSGRLPLTNELLVVPAREYEIFESTKSHGLVSLQFLCTLDIFFGGNISLSKYVLTELYYNFSYETLSGSKNFKFEAISDLTTDMSFQMRHSPLLNLKRKSEQDKKSNNDIKNSRDLFEKPGDDEEFENELKDLFKELEHVKTEHSYIELIVQDAETIETETRKRMMNFLNLL